MWHLTANFNPNNPAKKWQADREHHPLLSLVMAALFTQKSDEDKIPALLEKDNHNLRPGFWGSDRVGSFLYQYTMPRTFGSLILRSQSGGTQSQIEFLRRDIEEALAFLKSENLVHRLEIIIEAKPESYQISLVIDGSILEL